MKNKVICIIDDDLIYQILIEKTIKIADIEYDLITFYNGETAFVNFKNLLENNEPLPNLVLLDIDMPIMNGWEFLDQILILNSAALNNSRVYIVTSSISSEDKEKAESYKAIKGFYSKPIDKVKLEEMCAFI
jgi:response regulator RpfG family c-di-GMP phosphodiesterase